MARDEYYYLSIEARCSVRRFSPGVEPKHVGIWGFGGGGVYGWFMGFTDRACFWTRMCGFPYDHQALSWVVLCSHSLLKCMLVNVYMWFIFFIGLIITVFIRFFFVIGSCWDQIFMTNYQYDDKNTNIFYCDIR